MHCPYCRHVDTKVLDSRVSEDGAAIRRRRRCDGCDKRFTTVELMQLTVLKRSGATEPFTRDKAIAGVRKACKGRPVSEDDLACLGQTVEDALRNEGAAKVPAHEIGLAILGRSGRSTRSPTCGSRASTRRSAPPTTSRTRSRCSAWSRTADRRSSLSRPRCATTRRTHGITHRPPGPGVGKHAGRVHHRRWSRRPSTAGRPLRWSSEVETKREQDEGPRSFHDRDGEPDQGTKGAGKGLTIERVFSTPGTHPYDELTWERRDVVQTNWKSGETVFEQRGVEFPDFWSVNASTIVTTKYFRGAVGTEAASGASSS